MTNRFKLIAASLAAPLAIGLAAPAIAAPYGNWDRDQREYRDRGDYRDARGTRAVEQKLDRLRYDIQNAQRSGQLDRYEARSVRSKLNTAERAYAAFARNGVSRRDVQTVNWRIDQAYDALERAIYNNARRYDDRRGYRDSYRGGRGW